MSLLMLRIVSGLALLSTALAQATTSNSTLLFQVSSGGNENYFLRDNRTSAQVLLTSTNSSSPLRRLVVALPAGNSGALTYFVPLDASANANASLEVTLQNGSLASTVDEFDNVGVQADLAFSANATLGVTVVGAVRAMRDYVEGAGTMHEIFNYTLASFNSTSVRLHRQWINATSSGAFRSADLYLTALAGVQLNVTPGNNGTFTPPTIDVLVDGGGAGGVVQVRVLTNETSLTGLAPEGLFLPDGSGATPGVNTAIQGLADGSSGIAQQVSFLTFQDKFTAGGWRFLTYFGRDSMIALRLLMPTLTPDAIEAALGAVIERVNTTGALCHEETIGDYASFVNMGNNRSDLGNQPFYDYKMIDTDLFLLPTLAHFFLDLPQGKGRAPAFLARNATLQNGTYGELLNRTISYNLARALPFGGAPSVHNLLAFRPGEPVGNWRDSNQGTGYGPVPFDVNTALVPASLRATARLARAGLVANPDVGEAGPNLTLPSPLPGPPGAPGPATGNGSGNGTLADVADAAASVWEAEAPRLFEVSVDAATAEQRLVNFVNKANLSETLLGAGGNGTGSGGGNKTFYALSLMADGSPVEVLNSDLGFELLYGNNVTQTYLQRVVEALQPYPRGLLTNIGMVVANPAYDANTTNIDVLNRAAYHGTVIWSWQQGVMAGGLARQLGFCSNSSNATVDANPPPAASPTWCSNTTFVQSVVAAQTRLWTSIRGGVNEIFSEVWTYEFDNATGSFAVADLASLSPDGTESDAIQLWSYGFLGLLDPNGQRIGQWH